MLRSVDDAIAAIIGALAQEGQLDNTYLVFTSDNGYFSGEHRIRQGKYLPHEPSSHVPLVIRGPGVPAGGVTDELVSNVDIASTIAQIAGATPLLPQDGRSLLPFAEQPSLRTTRPILLEGDTGPSIDDEGSEGPVARNQADYDRFQKKLHRQKKKLRRRCNKLKRKSPRRAFLCYRRGVRNIEQEPVDTVYKLRAPAYRGIRTDRYALFLYATGEVELYDMWRDPYQLSSVASPPVPEAAQVAAGATRPARALRRCRLRSRPWAGASAAEEALGALQAKGAGPRPTPFQPEPTLSPCAP